MVVSNPGRLPVWEDTVMAEAWTWGHREPSLPGEVPGHTCGSAYMGPEDAGIPRSGRGPGAISAVLGMAGRLLFSETNGQSLNHELRVPTIYSKSALARNGINFFL